VFAEVTGGEVEDIIYHGISLVGPGGPDNKKHQVYFSSLTEVSLLTDPMLF
jgi:hypothetical protein